jgi:dimethylargininase
MLLALTRDISPAIVRCELTHLAREPIDLATARRQHEAYEQRLRDAGCTVVRLDADEEMPDSVFIEDIALVFDEVALMTRPGAFSRRRETDAVAAALAAYRPIAHVEAPATIDGGDVLTVGKRVFVGETTRTNPTAVTQMARHVSPYGYTVHIVPVHGCLHLKSAVTAVSDDTLLVNPEWVPAERFRPLTMIDVDPAEPYGANALRVGATVIYPTAFPRTRARLEGRGLRVAEVEVSEIAKAEGAVTCCSLIFTTE